MQKHHVSNFTKGWFVGDFEPSLFKTEAFEVGLKIHHRDEHIPKHKHMRAIEINLCALGHMRVNGEDIREGDIFVFEKGEVCDAKVISEVAHVICIKVPSIPSDKILCE